MISPVLFRMSSLVRVKSEHQVFRASTESFPTPCPHQNNDGFPDLLAYRGYVVVLLTYVIVYGSMTTVSSILRLAICCQARTCHVLGSEPDAHRRDVLSLIAHAVAVVTIIFKRTRRVQTLVKKVIAVDFPADTLARMYRPARMYPLHQQSRRKDHTVGTKAHSMYNPHGPSLERTDESCYDFNRSSRR